MLESILTVVGTVCLIVGGILLVRYQNKAVWGILLIAFICRFLNVAAECFAGPDLPARSILIMGLPSLLGIILLAILLWADNSINALKLFSALSMIVSLGVLVFRILSGILMPICLQLIIVLIFIRIAFMVFQDKK